MREIDRSANVEVRSLTGVDFALPVVGLGGRSYAFIIDWHIRLLAALAWLGCGLLLQRFELLTGQGAQILTFAPPLVIYFLYHPVLELLMGGLTPGKRMAGARIVMTDGTPAGAGAIVIRNVFRLIDSLPLFYVVGLVVVFVTRQNARVGDLAAGTLLVYDDTLARDPLKTLSLVPSRLTPAQADLVADLTQRWPEMDREHRGQLARKLLARLDPAFDVDASVRADDAALLARLGALLRPGEAADGR